MSEDELEAIRRKKLEELQRQALAAQQEEMQRKQAEQQIEAIMKQLLTPEARERLTNLKIVKPQLVQAVEIQLIQLAQAGRITKPLTDDQIKALLQKIQSGKKDPKIKFKRV